jgi:DNA-directed RNA polymerase specialized sigma24 family protein
MRYRRAIRRYLGGWFRNDERADEAAQAVYCRILAGECGKWDSTACRFRTFVLREVKNTGWQLINEWSRDRKIFAIGDISEPPETEWSFRCSESILEQAWASMNQYHERHFTLLRLRRDHPDTAQTELAQMTGMDPRNFNTELHRARKDFAKCIWDAIRDTLPNPTPGQIEEELIALNLMVHVRKYLNVFRETGHA